MNSNMLMSAPPPWMLALLAAVVLLVVLAFGTALMPAGPRQNLRKRAKTLQVRRQGAGNGAVAGAAASVKRSEGHSVALIENLAKRFLPRQSELRDRLARTGLSLSVSSYMLISIGIAVVAGAAIYIFAGFPAGACAAIGLAAGVGLPHLAVGFLGVRRRNRFMALLPDAIDLIVRGLRSGLPVTESIASVGRELPNPVGVEFRGMSDSVRLGASLDEVLWQTAHRLRTQEFNFFVISLSIQQETGGNLAETLSNLSDILRKRRQMRLKVKALSAEARVGAYILGALPFGVFGAMNAVNPGYPDILLSDPRGHVLLMLGAAMLTVGFATIVKLIRFEI